MSQETKRKRIRIKGHYMKVRQRSTTKGKKGTIVGKWRSDQRGKKRQYRCRLPLHSRPRRVCSRKKAGVSCLKSGNNGNKCGQLTISYN